MVALHRLGEAFEALEERVNADGVKLGAQLRTQPSQADITVPLQRFFETAKKKVKGRFVENTQLRTIEHNGRPVNIEATFEIVEDRPPLTTVYAFR